MNSNNSNNSKIAPIGNVSLYYSNNPLGYWSWRRENRKGQLADLAGIIRRNPQWLFRPDHRRMLKAMFTRITTGRVPGRFFPTGYPLRVCGQRPPRTRGLENLFDIDQGHHAKD